EKIQNNKEWTDFVKMIDEREDNSNALISDLTKIYEECCKHFDKDLFGSSTEELRQCRKFMQLCNKNQANITSSTPDQCFAHGENVLSNASVGQALCNRYDTGIESHEDMPEDEKKEEVESKHVEVPPPPPHHHERARHTKCKPYETTHLELHIEEDTELQLLENFRTQFELCKEIHILILEFWQKGGRKHGNDDLCYPVQDVPKWFDEKKIKWENTLKRWENDRFQLRKQYVSLNYFCINEVRALVAKFNKVRSWTHPQSKSIPSNTKQYIDAVASKYIVPFLQRIDSRFNEHDLFDFLRQWKHTDPDAPDAIENFSKVTEAIWKKHVQQVGHRPNGNSEANTARSAGSLKPGQPCLLFQKSKEVLFGILELFHSWNIPRPTYEHVLICRDTTTEEEVECLLFRALVNAARASADAEEDRKDDQNAAHDEVASSLYCLVWPEKLSRDTLSKVVGLFSTLLFDIDSPKRFAPVPYLLVVISSTLENELCQQLMRFSIHRPVTLEPKTANQIFSTMYCKDLSEFKKQLSTDFVKPLVQLYTSGEIGMGKSHKIKKDIQQLNMKRFCVAFNSGDIDWECVIQSFWRYHPCKNWDWNDNLNKLAAACSFKTNNNNNNNSNAIMYHLDLSSCVQSEINDFLFELLFLQHIDIGQSNLGLCFHVKPNMAFLIEIPSVLNQREELTSDSRKLLYLFSGPINFPEVDVNKNNNPFEFGLDARYSARWIQLFQSNKLKNEDPNPLDSLPSDNEMNTFITKNFPAAIFPTALHWNMFFKFSYPQFVRIAESAFLQNSILGAENYPVLFKHEVTKAVLEVCKDLCRRSYKKRSREDQKNANDNNNDNDDDSEFFESDEFYLCEKWHESKEFLYLVNQDEGTHTISFHIRCLCKFFFFPFLREIGTISLLISDTAGVNRPLLEDLKTLQFLLFNWKNIPSARVCVSCSFFFFFFEDTYWDDKEEMKKRVQLTFQILGVPVALHQKTMDDLSKGEFENFVLTYDNILKFAAITLKVRSNVPTILMGETFCFM
ncbi:hypothetical protein RFI_07687, partial [Reticulomyxa filosa]